MLRGGPADIIDNCRQTITRYIDEEDTNNNMLS